MSCCPRNLYIQQQVVGLFVIGICRQGQAVFEEADIYAKVCLIGCFPTQIIVGQTFGAKSRNR
ncbi:hypothetical protein Barb7_02141 [Bacteroidales bacterium Barb7]|nr:hypothetical protein Barb7_02141 [Bacteroidales bacterium Barb7]